MNFDNQVNRAQTPTSPSKRSSRALFESPKQALDTMSKGLASMKLSPRKDASHAKENEIPSVTASPNKNAGYIGNRLAVDRSPTRHGMSSLPVRKQTQDEKPQQVEVLRELTEEEVAIIRGRESQRLVTLSQLCMSSTDSTNKRLPRPLL